MPADTHDVAVTTAAGRTVYRYAREGEGWRLLGVVHPDGTVGPVPPTPPPPATYHPDGRMIHPPPPLDLSGLPVGDPPAVSMTEAAWGQTRK